MKNRWATLPTPDVSQKKTKPRAQRAFRGSSPELKFSKPKVRVDLHALYGETHSEKLSG
jgi:hypothetical protein